MSQIKSVQFVKKYTRESKSPWDDSSTMLWLANVASEYHENLVLDYSRYIYVHRNDVGQIVGISISKKMQLDHPNINSRYLSGKEMITFLLFYIDEIQQFCELWADEFEQHFLLPPSDYFEAVCWRWNSIAVRSD